MVVARFPRNEGSKAIVTTIHKVEIQMVGKWPASISTCRSIEQFVDGGNVVALHLSLYLKTPHESMVSGEFALVGLF